MQRRTIARLLSLVLMLTALLAGSEFGFAARKSIPSSKTTDAAGRTHVRPSGRISEAQKRAAARRRNAVRQAWMQSMKTQGGRQ